MEALRIATSGVPAFYRETNSFGAVETGQAANLVLLDADPLIDIRNTRRVLAVSVGGRWLDRTKLDHLYIAANGAKCTSGVPRADREVTRRFSVGLPLDLQWPLLRPTASRRSKVNPGPLWNLAHLAMTEARQAGW